MKLKIFKINVKVYISLFNNFMLNLICTPIGNLNDLSFRAKEVLLILMKYMQKILG